MSNYNGQHSLNSALAPHSFMFASARLAKIGTHEVKRLIQIYVGLNLLSHLVKAQKKEEECALDLCFTLPLACCPVL